MKTQLNISEAIKLSGLARSQFYKKHINTKNELDRITINVDGRRKYIEFSELLRACPNAKIKNTNIIENEQVRTLEDNYKDKRIQDLEALLLSHKEHIKSLGEHIETQRKELENKQFLLEDKTKRKKILGIF